MAERGTSTWERRLIPLLLLLAGVAAGLAWTAFSTPTYTAKTLVIISTDLAKTQARAETLAQGFGKAITTPDVLTSAAAKLKAAPADVARSVQQSVSPESPLIEVTGTAESAQGAADVANAFATGLVDLVTAQKQPGVSVALLGGAAVPPAAPGSPNLLVDLVVGAAAGVLLGVLYLVAAPRRHPVVVEPPPAAPASPVSTGPAPARPAAAPTPAAARPPKLKRVPNEDVTIRVKLPRLPTGRRRPPPQRKPEPPQGPAPAPPRPAGPPWGPPPGKR